MHVVCTLPRLLFNKSSTTSTHVCIRAISESSLADASNGLMPALVSEVADAISRVQALHAKLLLEGRMYQQGSECVTVCLLRMQVGTCSVPSELLFRS